MKNIFAVRGQLIDDYALYAQSFLHIRDQAIREYGRQQMDESVL